MKSSMIPLFLALAIISCSHDGKITQKNDDDTITTTSLNLNDVSINTDDVIDKLEELKIIVPLNLEQLKSLLPEAIIGVKRSSYNTNCMMGFGVAEANYSQDDKDLKLTIYDCAGEAGSVIFALSYVIQMNMQSESASNYTRTLDFQGTKAIETYEKNNNQSTFTYVVNDRLLVILAGRNIDNSTLKQVAQNLHIKV